MIKIDILILALITCIGKVNAPTNSSATITATTGGGQKLEVYCVSVVN